MTDSPKIKERYQTAEEVEKAIDWWFSRRNLAARHAKWFRAAATAFRLLAREENMPTQQAARLLIEANEADAEAAPLEQVGVLKLAELKAKLAEMRTAPMAGVIDGSVEK